jgi:hypothetical protein
MQPAETPKMYTAVESGGDYCTKMLEEIQFIDNGLGSPAEETPIPAPPTTWERVSLYGKNLFVQTILGPIQPIIQTVRALTSADAKAQAEALGRERALVRRAYLLGGMDANHCVTPLVDECIIGEGVRLNCPPMEPSQPLNSP